MKKKFYWSTGVLSLCLASAAWAEQGAHHHHHHHHQATAGHAAAETATAEGEVLKVDRKTRRITLKHGDLPHLGMGPMTMAFRVKDEAMLQHVKAGDKVRFNAARVNGAVTITTIEAID